MLQLIPKRSQNNAYHKKAGKCWLGIFSLPLVEMCRVFFCCCLKPHFGRRVRILKEPLLGSYLEFLICSQVCCCCCSSVSPNLSFGERTTTFSFSFLPLRCSCCHSPTVTKSLLRFISLENLKIPIDLLLSSTHAVACAQLESSTN